MEEIVVRRADRQLYKLKEGDFVNLHLNNIEDILLLLVQHKLFHLDGDVIVDLAVALRMFTRSLIIKKRVEDVQLGVESYQKKLNITKPQKDFPRISAKEPYTPSFEPLGVFYEDLSHQKRLMRADELYKFLDGTLKKVRDTLHHRLRNFRLGYNDDMPRRKWSAMDQKRSGIMVDLIDKHMLERRILRNLERLVSARELEMDYRLMQRTVIPMVAAADSRQRRSVKVKELQEILPIQSFKIKMKWCVCVACRPKVTSTQDGKRSQDDDKRLCLVDDLKKLKITYKSSLKEQAQA
ncbi:hypothetical protein Tco_0328220 [Tanacetum coccineum]